jgi:uncharacterized cupin superfamily protein
MIVRRAGLRSGREGEREWLYYSDAGGLTQYGAYVETLQPGARASEEHWHEKEDEFLYVLAGGGTVIEDGAEAVLHPGDAACWLAGESIGHAVANRSAAPCTYLTRFIHERWPGYCQSLRREAETPMTRRRVLAGGSI